MVRLSVLTMLSILFLNLAACGTDGQNVPANQPDSLPEPDMKPRSDADAAASPDVPADTVADKFGGDLAIVDGTLVELAPTDAPILPDLADGGELDAQDDSWDSQWLEDAEASGQPETWLDNYVTPDLGSDDCTPEKCGIYCNDEDVCGTCGNGICDEGETEEDCPTDCCNPALCEPGTGPEFGPGTALCGVNPDGYPCSDGNDANGMETCQAEICRYEHPHCHCTVGADGVFDFEVDPEGGEPPSLQDLPEWTGAIPEEPSFEDAWGLQRIEAGKAWEITQGDPDILLAVIDTGCDETAPDLAGRIVAQWDVLDQDEFAEDANGHGTVLATVAAGNADGTGVVGVAPGISLLCIRAAPQEGITTYASLAAGLDWAVENGASVVLFGHGGAGVGEGLAQLKESVEAAAQAGVVMVAPAGSHGPSNLDVFPAAFAPDVISVSALLASDTPSPDNTLAPDTWLLAPGHAIIGVGPAGGLVSQDGSSVSAALAAGAAALVRSVDPDLTPGQVRAVLRGQSEEVPWDDFDRLFKARILNAGRAVQAVADVKNDASIEAISLGLGKLLPGQPATAWVTVENRSAYDLEPVSVSLSANGADVAVAGQMPSGPDATVQLDSLTAGEAVEITFTVEAIPGEASVQLTATVAANDDDDGNDSLAIEAEVADQPVHSVRILRAEMLPGTQGSPTLPVLVTVENQGNVPAEARKLFAAVWPEAAEVVELDIPKLQPGQRQDIQFDVTPGECGQHSRCQLDLRVQPASGQTDLSSAVAILRFRHQLDGDWAQKAYMQLPGDTLIADAPWRSMLGKVPVLIFYARTHWVQKVGPPLIKLPIIAPFRMGWVKVRNPDGPKSGVGPVIYEDHYNKNPTTVPAGAYVVNEYGTKVLSNEVVWTEKPKDGEHRILWLPADSLPNKNQPGPLDPASKAAFLEVEFRYKTAHIQLWYSDKTRRMLAVQLGTDKMPKFVGTDHYFDAHYHSIAEWYRGKSPVGPAKAYGGPLWMTSATGAAIGMLDTEDFNNSAEKIITTDHNDFFNDDDAPEAGPTSKQHWAGNAVTGSEEFDVYRKKMGSTAGEETTLQGQTSGAFLGRHALTYRCSHVDGSWGWIGGIICSPPFSNFLRRVACNPGEQGHCDGPAKSLNCIGGDPAKPKGFVYAAHPFTSGFVWQDDILRQALSLPPHSTQDFVTADREFVFRGYQFFNTRQAQGVQSSFTTLGYRDVNPYVGAVHDSWWKGWKTWKAHCDGAGGYRTGWQNGMKTYMNHVRDGLQFTFSDQAKPRERFFRKFYVLGGSDAHGDFGFNTNICSTLAVGLCHIVGKNDYSDSAYARPRTYVIDGTLEDMRNGKTVVTDGPILEIELDPDSRYTYDKATGQVTWHDGVDKFEDWDGQIGGDGLKDAGRTALVPLGLGYKDAQRFRLRYRCKNIADFGGNTVEKLELIVSGEAGTSDDPTTIDLTPIAVCDGNWQEANVFLGASPGNPEEMLWGPVAVAGHLVIGNTCPGTYDAYTNPIWVSTVNTVLPLQVSQTTEDQFKMTQEDQKFEIKLNFRQSMLTQDLVARIKAIDANTGALIDLAGGVDGQGGVEPVPPKVFGWEGVPPGFDPPIVSNLILTMRIPYDKPITGPLTTSIKEQRYVLVVTRKLVDSGKTNCNDARLCDAFGNPIGILAVKFKPSATCNQKSCGGGDKWCESKCQCVQAYDCPEGTMNYGGCECCWSWDCFPLPCSCKDCAPTESVFWMTCPGG